EIMRHPRGTGFSLCDLSSIASGSEPQAEACATNNSVGQCLTGGFMRARKLVKPRTNAILACTLGVLLLSALTPAAQKKNMLGGAHGILHLARGAPVEGVGVQLISAKTAIRTTVYSGEDGKFEFPVLEAGTYTLRVPSPREFKPYVRESVQISGASQIDDIVVERLSNTEFVPPTPETLSQLTGAEWMMNIPGNGEQKETMKL